MNNNIVSSIDKNELNKELFEMFYDRNFGMASKSDMELLLFKYYFKAAKENASTENIIDYNKISDYKIGRDLGLSPAKVKNLRLKMDLYYVDENYDWKDEFSRLLCSEKNLSVDAEYTRINVRSRFLFNAVRDWLEDDGHIVGITLNNNELKLKNEDFFVLVKHVCGENAYNQVIDELKKNNKTDTNDGNNTSVLDTIKSFTAIGVDISQILLNITQAFSESNTVINILRTFTKLFKNNIKENDK